MRGQLIRVAAVTAGWLAACYLVRYRYVEVDELVGYCAANAQAVVCAFREIMGKAMHFNVLGYTSLALALLATLLAGRTGRWVGMTALLAAVAALVFYNASLGAPAAVLALLRLARSPGETATAAPRPAPG
jgi:hypothetical protein